MMFPRFKRRHHGTAYRHGRHPWSDAGIMGLLIATVGIPGVISFAVSQRTKEIGIRMALGAMRGQVLGAVLKA